jgi:hypothetical protein
MPAVVVSFARQLYLAPYEAAEKHSMDGWIVADLFRAEIFAEQD